LKKRPIILHHQRWYGTTMMAKFCLSLVGRDLLAQRYSIGS
jgi:hypothetical protein